MDLVRIKSEHLPEIIGMQYIEINIYSEQERHFP